MDYIRNSKNRKLKTQILHFFSRLSFGTYRLGFPGKALLFCTCILIASLFFPWLGFRPLQGEKIEYWAFSLYLGGVGYGIIFGALFILFFLLSHEKKEHLRSYVPFRLSDTQAIVFTASLLFVACVHAMITSFAYARIASSEVTSSFGLELATGSLLLIILFSYFLSQNEKSRAVTMGYLDKKEQTHIDEYREILGSTASDSSRKSEEKNMTLPI